MTTRDEATVAREALLQLVNEFTDGTQRPLLTVSMRERMIEYINREWPAPAPRKVRGEYSSTRVPWDAFCVRGGVQIEHRTNPSVRVWVPSSDLQALAALDARADADGMVEEESQERLVAVAPSPNASEDMEDSPSPPVAPTPAPAGDGRVWWLIFDRHSDLVCAEPERRADWQRDVQDSQYPDVAPHVVIPVVPRSELERVQRERADWKARAGRENYENTTLRAQLADVQRERDEVVRRAEDEANARIREAEQAISTLRSQLAAATGPLSEADVERIARVVHDSSGLSIPWDDYGIGSKSFERQRVRDVLRALGRTVEGA